MPAGKAALSGRRLVVAVSGTNFTVFDGGLGTTTTTAIAAAGTQTLNLFTLEGGAVIVAAKCKPTVAFTGGAVTATTVEVGFANATDTHLARFNIFVAVADAATRRKFQVGPTWKTALVQGNNGVGAVTATAALAAGDGVVAVIALTPRAGFSSTGELLAAATPLKAGVDFESVVSVVDQLQQRSATNLSDVTLAVIATDLQGSTSDAAAGTAINALIRTTGANVSALTAGSMEINLFIWDAPLRALGIG